MTTLVTSLGAPQKGYDAKSYRSGERRTENRESNPSFGLIELFSPERVVFLCTDSDDIRTEFELCSEHITKRWPGIRVESKPIAMPHSVADLAGLLGTVREVVAANEPVHLDITMGARSIGTGLLLAAAYLDAAQEVTLTRVTYINSDARSISDPKDEAEVVDLTEMLRMPRLAAAVRDLEAGDLPRFLSSIHAIFPELEQETADIDVLGARLNSMRVREIISNGGQKRIRGIISQLEDMGNRVRELAPLANRARRILEDLGNLEAGTAGAYSRLVSWYLERGQIEHALTIIVEAHQFLIKDRVLGDSNTRGSRSEVLHQARSIYIGRKNTRILELSNKIDEDGTNLRDYLNHASLIAASKDRGPVQEEQVRELRDLFDEFCRHLDQHFRRAAVR